MFSLNTIELLNGSNYKKWRAQVELYLGLQNLDLCLLEDQPEALSETSSKEEKKNFNAWVRSNRMAKNVIKTTMSDTVRGSVAEPDSAKDFFAAIAEKYKESEKAEIAHLLQTFQTTKYSGSGNVREHIMKLIDIAAKLKNLNMTFSDDQVVHQALLSLPDSFSQLNTAYLAQKDKWGLNELIAICVETEDRMKSTKGVTVNLVSKPKWKNNKLKPTKTITKEPTAAAATALKANRPFKFKCYFCKKVGHMKKDCTGYKDWVAKKGIHKEEGAKK